MSIITAKGQTVEKAVQEALTQLEVLRDQVDVKIVDEGKRGFLGFLGSRPAIVEVVLKKILSKKPSSTYRVLFRKWAWM